MHPFKLKGGLSLFDDDDEIDNNSSDVTFDTNFFTSSTPSKKLNDIPKPKGIIKNSNIPGNNTIKQSIKNIQKTSIFSSKVPIFKVPSLKSNFKPSTSTIQQESTIEKQQIVNPIPEKVTPIENTVEKDVVIIDEKEKENKEQQSIIIPSKDENFSIEKQQELQSFFLENAEKYQKIIKNLRSSLQDTEDVADTLMTDIHLRNADLLLLFAPILQLQEKMKNHKESLESITKIIEE